MLNGNGSIYFSDAWVCFTLFSFFKVPLSEFEFSWSKISDIQSQVSLIQLPTK